TGRLLEQVAPAGSDGAHVVVNGKSAVSVSARPMDSATVVESVSEAVDVSPMAVCGKLSVAALTEIAPDGVVTCPVQAAQSTKNKGDVRTATKVVDLDIVPASSRRHATRASSKTARVTSSAFSEQDDASTRVSEYFDACPCTFLRRAAAS